MVKNHRMINIIAYFCSFFLSISCNEEELLTTLQAQQYVIAHRGSYMYHGLPENSRASLLEALSLQIYGTEFDVRQTKDGELVISHDGSFNGMDIAETSYDELSKYKLANGEVIPTLRDFFTIYKGALSSKILFVELKDCDVKKVVDLVKEFDIHNNIKYISFNKTYCDQLVHLDLGKFVLYLGGDLSPIEVKNEGYSGISYQESAFISHPDWLKEAHDLGLVVCVWPINNLEKMRYFINKDVLISTDYPYLFSN